MKEFLYPCNTLLGKIDQLILFVKNKVTGFLRLAVGMHHGIHNRIQLVDHFLIITALHLLCKHVAYFIKLGSLSALTGYDKRGTGFVDKDGVHLVDDGIMQATLNQLLLIDDHVVTEIIETKFVVCYISDVTSVHCTALLTLHIIGYISNGKS